MADGFVRGQLWPAAGFVAFALTQSLAEQHVPEVTIASITALAVSPGFFSFLASPLLDVWFSRRAYATALVTTSAVLLGSSVLLFHHLLLLRIATLLGYTAIQLASSAIGGWLATVAGKNQENQLSAWFSVSNVGGFGAMAFVGGELIRRLQPALAAGVIGVLILLPIYLFVWIPSPGPDGRLAGESFRAFWAEVFRLFRKPEVLVAITLFLAPCATFSLTNMLGGFGADFRASPRAVGLLGGAGAVASGVCGSLLLPIFASGCACVRFTWQSGPWGRCLPWRCCCFRVPGSFVLVVLGANAFQSLAITCSLAISFETIGQDNPLAATNYAILTAAYNVPISYMLVVDGWGYARAGVTGAFAVDAGVGVSACVVMGMVLLAVNRWYAKRRAVTTAATA